MTALTTSPRIAGWLYALIIVMGLSAELALRGPAFAAPDLTDHLPALRLSLLADLTMLIADIALALVFFALLKPFGEAQARAAMVFRLGQAALIGASLILLSGAPALVEQGQPDLARTLAALHANGYDIGLVLFGINAMLMATLLRRASAPRVLPPMLAGSGLVYIAGGIVRLAAPGLTETLQPAYLLCIVTETALAIWLLTRARL